MVVSIDKATALKTFTKARRAWEAETARVRAALAHTPYDDVAQRQELIARRQRLETIDMAVVVSPGQNEVEELSKQGLDIVPHRKRMNESQPPLDEKFKDPKDPLSLVFVCAMWITGFDVPSCSTVYLDKPMRNHTLVQTIARANRIYAGKHCGLIVDYANVFASLEKALALYGAGVTGATGVRNKDALVEELRRTLGALERFCSEVGANLAELEAAPTAQSRLELFGQAVSTLLGSDERRKSFLAQAGFAARLYAAIKPHQRAVEFATRMATVTTLAQNIRSTLAPEQTDLADVLGRIGEVLDRSIAGATILRDGPPAIDLSRIDFKALAARFRQSKTKNLDIERLKAAVRAQLDHLITVNETRVDLREKFEALIEEYNRGSLELEQLFEELVQLSRSLTEEESRHVREQLGEDELVIFDLLTRPGPDLTTAERDEVKKVARTLLNRIRGLVASAVDWQKTAKARARVREAIEEALDEGLPRAYTPDIFKAKTSTVFQHIYERYGKAA